MNTAADLENSTDDRLGVSYWIIGLPVCCLAIAAMVTGAIYVGGKRAQQAVVENVSSAISLTNDESHPVKRYQILYAAATNYAMHGCRADNPFVDAALIERRCTELRTSVDKAHADALAYASDQAATTTDVATLKYLAEELASGDQVTRNISQAIALYTRAYELGDIESADKLSALFASLSDNVNAYLWALRCVGCSSNAFHRSELVRLLTADQVHLAEAAARSTQARVDDAHGAH